MMMAISVFFCGGRGGGRILNISFCQLNRLEGIKFQIDSDFLSSFRVFSTALGDLRAPPLFFCSNLLFAFLAAFQISLSLVFCIFNVMFLGIDLNLFHYELNYGFKLKFILYVCDTSRSFFRWRIFRIYCLQYFQKWKSEAPILRTKKRKFQDDKYTVISSQTKLELS